MFIRPNANDPHKPVRIVRCIQDSTLDQFVSVDTALTMLEANQLREINLGPRYPLSFMHV
jgi:hypothetical protein